jgi:hypothetical protein
MTPGVAHRNAPQAVRATYEIPLTETGVVTANASCASGALRSLIPGTADCAVFGLTNSSQASPARTRPAFIPPLRAAASPADTHSAHTRLGLELRLSTHG